MHALRCPRLPGAALATFAKLRALPTWALEFATGVDDVVLCWDHISATRELQLLSRLKDTVFTRGAVAGDGVR